MTPKFYTGIGSRETPRKILDRFIEIAERLAKLNYTLRSGGASGADSAFETGCDTGEGKKEIYLPWKNFNYNRSILYNVGEDAIELAKEVHPAWDKLTQGGQKLMGRNCYQVLGLWLNSPSKFVIGYTKVENGQRWGGTSLAMNLADKHDIPVFNFFLDEDVLNFEIFMKKLKKNV
jgi:hypothetical protein